jgi:hypothetical protein
LGAVFISLSRLLNQIFTVFTSFLAHGFASSDVLFTSLKSQLKPFVDLSESWVIGVNHLLFSTFDDSLAVRDSLVNLVFFRLLSQNLILAHGFGKAGLNVLFGNFPPELLGVWLTDFFFLKAH